jgi:hypothetical protein
LIDDVVDSAPKWRTIHWRCTKSLTNLWTRCASIPKGSLEALKWQPTFVCVSRIRTWFVSEHEQLHGQAIR